MPRGRPRAFDADAALDQAMRVFWKSGYEGASLPDLTAAMGINRPSMYAAFGNKEALFRKAVERYTDAAESMVREALSQPTARESVEQLLRNVIGKPSRKSLRGCFLVQGALACADASKHLRDELAKRRGGIEAALRERFKRAIAENDVPDNANPAALAKYFATFIHGLAVQSTGNATREALTEAARIAMKVLAPSPVPSPSGRGLG